MKRYSGFCRATLADIDASFASGDIENTQLLVSLYDEYGELVRSADIQKEIHLPQEPAENGDFFCRRTYRQRL